MFDRLSHHTHPLHLFVIPVSYKNDGIAALSIHPSIIYGSAAPVHSEQSLYVDFGPTHIFNWPISKCRCGLRHCPSHVFDLAKGTSTYHVYHHTSCYQRQWAILFKARQNLWNHR